MDDTDPPTDIFLRAVLIKYGGTIVISEKDLQLANLTYGWQADIDPTTRRVTLGLIVLPESREADLPD